MAKLSEDQVKHVAKLANLPVTKEEIKQYSHQLSDVLSYIEQLDQVDTSKVEPTFNVSGQINVYHQDVPEAALNLQNTKYVVKRLIGGSDE